MHERTRTTLFYLAVQYKFCTFAYLALPSPHPCYENLHY